MGRGLLRYHFYLGNVCTYYSHILTLSLAISMGRVKLEIENGKDRGASDGNANPIWKLDAEGFGKCWWIVPGGLGFGTLKTRRSVRSEVRSAVK